MGFDDLRTETPAPLNTSAPRAPHADDPNYLTLVKMRDQLGDLARSKAVTNADRVRAAKAAADVAVAIIDIFGIESGSSEGTAEQAAVEAGRRAYNVVMFGAMVPVEPKPWVTIPGDPNPQRAP